MDYNLVYDSNILKFNELTFINKWILIKLNKTIKTINEKLKSYDFGEATNKFYSFYYYEFCDVYLEAIKSVLYEGTKDDLHIANTIL
jgi:valyl-tRNA synthetase